MTVLVYRPKEFDILTFKPADEESKVLSLHPENNNNMVKGRDKARNFHGKSYK